MSIGARDVDQFEVALSRSPKDLGIMQKLMAAIKTNKARRPDLVIKCGPALLSKKSLGNAQWDIREQVFVAALDLHLFDVAKAQIDELEARFPKSLRVNALEGMMLEAQAGSQSINHEERDLLIEEVIGIYDKILEEDPVNVTAHKRKVGVQRGKGTAEGQKAATIALNEYLDLYPTDADGWRELADMYLEQQHIEHARKALEEVVMLTPVNYLAHLKLADTLYTLEDYPTARKYYAQSLELNAERNARASIGLVLTSAAIDTPKGKAGKGDATNTALYRVARDTLLSQYDSLPRSAPGAKIALLVKTWLRA